MLQCIVTDEDLRGRNVYISICFHCYVIAKKNLSSPIYLCRSNEPLPNYKHPTFTAFLTVYCIIYTLDIAYVGNNMCIYIYIYIHSCLLYQINATLTSILHLPAGFLVVWQLSHLWCKP